MSLDLPRLHREARAVLRSIAPRWRDLAALGPLLTYGPTLPAVGLAAARRLGDTPLVIDADGAVSGTQLEAAAWSLARRIRGQVRSGPGGSPPLVALHCRGHRGFLAAVVAAGVLGVDLLLIPDSMGEDQRSQVLAQEPVQAVLTDAHVLAAFDDRTPRPHRRPRPRRPGRLLLLSSGTSGSPGVSARGGVGGTQLATVLSLLTALDLRRGEPVLLAPPLPHGHGLSVLAAALITGAPGILVHGQHPARILQLAREHQATGLLAVPAQLTRMITYLAQNPQEPIPPLRRIAAGSAPLPPDTARAIINRWGPVLVDYYGSSEAGTATIATSTDLLTAPGTVGRAANGVVVRILDEEGRQRPAGRVGRVQIDSPWRASNSAGAHTTSDEGRLDAAGRLFVLRRTDDIVVVGGHNVHLGQVREWFSGQPGVQRATVHPVADAVLGHVLEVHLHGTDLDSADLQRRARRQLGSAAAPRRVIVSPAAGV